MEMSAERLFSENAIVRLTFRTWSNKKEKATDSERRQGEWYRFVDPKELQPINAIVRKAREYLSSAVGMHFNWGTGLYLVRRERLIQVLEKLRDFQYEFVDAVEEFVEDKYEAALDETREKGLLDDAQLDTAPPADTLFDKFKMTFTTFVVSLPQSTGDTTIDQTLQSDFCDALDESFADVGETLRQELVKMLETVYVAVTDADRKKYYSSMLDNIIEWCVNFEARNFLADENLAAIAENAKGMAEGVTIDDIRGSTETKQAMAGQVRKLLDDAIALKPARRKIIL